VLFKRLLSFNVFIIDGRDGWLFYRGELDYAVLPWTGAAKKLARLDAFAKQNNVRLVMVPVPNKIDLYPEKLDGRLRGPGYLRNRYSRILASLKNDNVNVVDLFDNYEKAKDSVPVYDPDEAHTTSEGLKVAAEETVRQYFAPLYTETAACLGRKSVSFVGGMATKRNGVATARNIDIYCNSCHDTVRLSDTVLVIGDSYCNYLEKDQGSFGDLLMCWLGNHYVLKRYYKVNAGFAQGRRIVDMITMRPRHKTIIWIFSAREFYKPLHLGF
jgi:hypothetical protein